MAGSNGWLAKKDEEQRERGKGEDLQRGGGRLFLRQRTSVWGGIQRRRKRRWSCGSSGKATLGLNDFRLNVLFHSLC